jgi:hypothetical protein
MIGLESKIKIIREINGNIITKIGKMITIRK